MNSGERTFMTSVHRLQHVQCLAAAALADDDAIGPHEILDRVTFLEEFGVGDHREEMIGTARGQFLQQHHHRRRMRRVARHDHRPAAIAQRNVVVVVASDIHHRFVVIEKPIARNIRMTFR